MSATDDVAELVLSVRSGTIDFDCGAAARTTDEASFGGAVAFLRGRPGRRLKKTELLRVIGCAEVAAVIQLRKGGLFDRKCGGKHAFQYC